VRKWAFERPEGWRRSLCAPAVEQRRVGWLARRANEIDNFADNS